MRSRCGVEAQRIAHAVVDDARRALPRPVGFVGIAVVLDGATAFEIDLARLQTLAKPPRGS